MNKKAVTESQILSWIEDYRWMVECIEESRHPLDDGGYIGAKIAAYGIDATMPKAQGGGSSDPVFFEVQRRLQFGGKRVSHYEQKVLEIQKRISKVTGTRENEVLDRLLSGESMRAIGRRMHLSTTTVSKIREKIVKQMSV